MTKRTDSLLAKHEALINDFSDLHMDIRESRRYYDLDFASNVVPERWRQKLTPFIHPTAAHAIDEAVDHILFSPRIRVMTRPGDAERKLAEQDIAENKRMFLAA